MSVDTRPVPCNVLAQTRIRDLITQQKFIYTYLYFCPDATACGCFLFSIERAAADMSMTPNSLNDAMDEFARRGLIDRDKITGEIWIVDWLRWHRFNTPQARGALWASINKIQSRKLWITVKKTYESIPEPGKGKEKTKDKDKASSNEEETSSSPPLVFPPPVESAAPSKKINCLSRSEAGINCWTIDDKNEATALEEVHGLENVKAAIKTLIDQGISPLPSRVSFVLNRGTESRLERDWSATEASTLRTGSALNVHPLPGESFQSFRERICLAIQNQKRRKA